MQTGNSVKYLCDSIFKRRRSQSSGPLHRSAVVTGPPAGRVDIDKLRI